MKQPHARLHVLLQSLSWRSTTGFLLIGNLRLRCAMGRSGIHAMKREGDGATPAGTYRLVRAFYRPDRLRRPRTMLPVRRLHPDDGWCDAAGNANYNRQVRHPYPASAEHMWRRDGLYDVVVVLDHNQRPRVQGLGSAIFMHIARDGYRPTEGCIALAKCDLLKVIACLRADTRIVIR